MGDSSNLIEELKDAEPNKTIPPTAAVSKNTKPTSGGKSNKGKHDTIPDVKVLDEIIGAAKTGGRGGGDESGMGKGKKKRKKKKGAGGVGGSEGAGKGQQEKV